MSCRFLLNLIIFSSLSLKKNKHIKKIQICKNTVTLYSNSGDGNKHLHDLSNKYFLNSFEYNFVRNHDSDHLGLHRNRREMKSIHIHIKYKSETLISNETLANLILKLREFQLLDQSYDDAVILEKYKEYGTFNNGFNVR